MEYKRWLCRWHETRKVSRTQTYRSKELSEEGYDIEVEEEATISKYGIARKVPSSDNDTDKLTFIDDVDFTAEGVTPDSVLRIKQLKNQRYLEYRNKNDMVSLIVTELVNSNKEITERLNRSHIDSVLHKELKNKGINVPYVFGVFCKKCTEDKQFLFSSKNERKQLLKADFHAILFPNDFVGNENILLLHFPEKDLYMLKKLGSALATSAFLIIVIFAFEFVE